MSRLFCFGLGFSALTLADRLLADGWSVAGTCRTEEKRDRLVERGLEAHLLDRGRPLDDAAAALDGTTHLLCSVPPGDDGDPVLEHHASDIAALAAERSDVWAGYLSTTGVYGDRDGGWVDENSALEPTGERGQRRLDAERRWLALGAESGLAVHLFRLSGIYGPGRSALDSVRRGRARRLDKPGQIFNRIHVEDIAGILQGSMAHPNPGAAYNCADDDPAPPQDVIAHACTLLGVDPPPLVPFEEAELSPMARSFYADNKRVRNERIKAELGVTLAFPSYRDGFAAQLKAGL